MDHDLVSMPKLLKNKGLKRHAMESSINERKDKRFRVEKRTDSESSLHKKGRPKKTQLEIVQTDEVSSKRHRKMIENRPWTRHLDRSEAFESKNATDVVCKRGRPTKVKQEVKCQTVDDKKDSSKIQSYWEKLILKMSKSMTKGEINCRWNRRCNDCGLELLSTERKGFCCNNGKYRLPPLPKLPASIEGLYSNARFCRDSRKINNLFCFTVLGVKGSFIHLAAPSCVSIMGRTYHRLLPTVEESNPLRWYIYDESERYDMASSNNIKFEWVSQIAAMLSEINPFAQALKNVGNLNKKEIILTISGTTAKDEVAAIADVSNTTTIEPRIIGFCLRHEGSPIFISILDPLYETLQYPLFFPHGTIGWSPRNEFGLSQIQWYKQRLLHETRFAQLGRLCGEYLVDMFSRVEEERLNYICTEGYKKPARMDQDDFGDSSNDSGDDVILPSSFLGCRRWCSSQVADALALARSKGHPTLFITMTTNPDWVEIREKLSQGKSSADLPVIVCRAFHSRLHELKKLLKQHFGPISYMIHVIEFQKRGLPHAHLVLRTEIDIPISVIDQIICAELPTDTSERVKVEKFMVHHHSFRCSEKGSCCWKFPRPIVESSYIDDKGYVQYRRRHVDDAFVVPYNKFLLEKMNCHITIDVASTVHIFSYVYSYIYKGFDSIKYQLQKKDESAGIADAANSTKLKKKESDQDDREKERVNEVRDYLNARYLSATEAAWRILGYNMTKKTPAVRCLPLHLPGQNKQQFGRTDKSSTSLSLLDRYFLRPNKTEFNEMTYVEYNEKYVLVSNRESSRKPDDNIELNNGQIVRKRASQNLVCRIRLLLPHTGEPFYLRQILLHKPCRDWIDAKTINGVEHETYQKAAEALGLLDASNEADLVLEEAVALALKPSQLRFLFALLLMDQAPALELWDRYQFALARDMFEKYQNDDKSAYNECLQLINDTLVQHGTNISAFGLQIDTNTNRAVITEISKFANTNTYQETLNSILPSLNCNQKEIFALVRAMIDKKAVIRPTFIDGKAGTGKTYLLNALCLYVRACGLLALPCGTTALAALLYPGGRTAHSLFQIPISENNINVHSIMTRKSGYAELLLQSSIIVWDEFPMANKAVISAVNNLLQELCGNKEPFGGKCIVATGDFRQVAPIVHGAGRTAAINASIKSSTLWNSFNVLKLHQPVRNATDKELIAYVDQIGEDFKHSLVSVAMFATTTNIDDAIDFLYPGKTLANSSECEKRAFLSPLNRNVDDFNQRVMSLLRRQEKRYYSLDHITENDQRVDDHPYANTDFLMHFTHPGIPDHELSLKVGAVCHVIKTLDREKGLVKNARVIIEALHEKFVMVKVIGSTAKENDTVHPIYRVDSFYEPENRPWTIHRRQLSLRLAYSTTFNSCQGLTLDKIVLDLRNDVFAHGQLYTALTRIRKREDVLILLRKENTSLTTTNIVYEELLR